MTTVDPSPAGQAPPVPPSSDVTTVVHLQGPFAPVIEETDAADLPVEGELPHELNGVYLRNGPNPRFTPLGSYVLVCPAFREIGFLDSSGQDDLVSVLEPPGLGSGQYRGRRPSVGVRRCHLLQPSLRAAFRASPRDWSEGCRTAGR
jgi:hypothetical protein